MDLDPTSQTYRRCTDPVRPLLGPGIAEVRETAQVTRTYQNAQASEVGWSVYGDDRSDAIYESLFRPAAFGSLPMVVLTHEDPPSADPLDHLGSEQSLRLHRETARLSTRGNHRLVPRSGHYIQLDRPDEVIAAIEEVLRMPAHDTATGP